MTAYVDDDGRVAYRRLQAEARPPLDAYLATLAVARIEALPPADQLAFWLNAYNAMMVVGVLDGYSAESLFGRYRFFKSYARRLAGRDRSPEDVEHGIIRRQFKDFRIHFALVCASTSCPVLRREAYSGARLDAQLDDQARRFLGDPRRNRFDRDTGAVQLSAIFEWFAVDFTGGKGLLIDALAPYLTPDQKVLLGSTQPTFLDYDWTLNAQPGQRP